MPVGNRPREPRHHLVGVRAGRDVPVAADPPEQHVAHRAADGHRLEARAGEHVAHLAHRRRHRRGQPRQELIVGGHRHSVVAAARSRS
jgi:hypothetical protein